MILFVLVVAIWIAAEHLATAEEIAPPQPSELQEPAGDADLLAREVRDLASELRCPVCQNLSVADSPSPMAVQMRQFMREELSAGKSKKEVMNYLVEKYGEWILLAPKRSGFNWILWGGGPGLLIAGAIIVVLWFRKHRTPITVSSAELSPEAAKRLQEELKRLEE